ncbi:MAG: manganese-dependent inorganic pyrophosphatase [Candidatus Omnitrophica bacterium]|nr:manganese-dependent inorganic pyrophosphatase [Candidatus Omnitrophota bacterium]
MAVYIIGHKNPDVDSVCSAIIYSYIKNQMGFKNIKPARAGEINEETELILKRFNFRKPALLKDLSGKEVILVDHNEASQAQNGIKKAKILEVIDHHRIGDMETGEPVLFINRPFGATASVLAMEAEKNNVHLTEKIKGLILGAVLSDTSILRSTATTKYDRRLVKHFSKELGINYEKFGMEIFKAKTKSITGTTKKVMESDYKKIKLKKKVIGISQVKTTEPCVILARKKELLKYMERKTRSDKLNIMIAMVSDIEKNRAILIVPNSDILEIQRAFNKKVENNELILEGVLSRKHQLVPILKKVFG